MQIFRQGVLTKIFLYTGMLRGSGVGMTYIVVCLAFPITARGRRDVIQQSVIFHVERHPKFSWFTQCVTFNFFPSQDHELAYNMFSIIALYGLPLTIITSAYCVIMCRISQKSRQSKYEISGPVCDRKGNEQAVLRRSGVGNIERAKARTLKMTLVIVGAYVMCWTPYFVISAWFYFDRSSALKIDSKVQRGLFIFAVSNSCINPLVYGMFTIKFKRELIRCCYCLRGRIKRRQKDDSNGIRRSLLFPLKRNSESSSSYRHSERVARPPTHQNIVSKQQLWTFGRLKHVIDNIKEA